MPWWRVTLWLLLVVVVLVILGGYVVTWYRQQVSSQLDALLAGGARSGTDDEDAEPVVHVAPARSLSSDEQALLHLNTGYVDDD